jgi:phosphate/sulfate permease
MQIFSAMVMSFAHGSNDVANAMGPFSAVYYIWVNQAVPTKSPVSRPSANQKAHFQSAHHHMLPASLTEQHEP